MKRFSLSLFLLGGLASLALGQESRFKIPAKKLIAGAKKPPSDEKLSLEGLRTHFEIRMDDKGLLTTRRYFEFVVRNQQASKAVARFHVPWSPWFQVRPTMRARVVQPDGKSLELNPADSAIAPVQQAQDVFTNDLMRRTSTKSAN